MDDLHQLTISDTKVAKPMRDEVKTTTACNTLLRNKCVEIARVAFCLSLHMKKENSNLFFNFNKTSTG